MPLIEYSTNNHKGLRTFRYARNNERLCWQHEKADDGQISAQKAVRGNAWLQTSLAPEDFHGAVEYETSHQVFDISLCDQERLGENFSNRGSPFSCSWDVQ